MLHFTTSLPNCKLCEPSGSGLDLQDEKKRVLTAVGKSFQTMCTEGLPSHLPRNNTELLVPYIQGALEIARVYLQTESRLRVPWAWYPL